MPTPHRTVAAVLVAFVLAACVPPPPPPPPLPGLLTFEGRQVLTSSLCDSHGCVPVCQLYLDTGIDLGYETALVRAKVAAAGACVRADWTNVAATMECVPDCGLLALQVTPATVQSVWRFKRPPAFAHITTTFVGTIHGQPSTPAVGDTPQIRCSEVEHQCKFQ